MALAGNNNNDTFHESPRPPSPATSEDITISVEATRLSTMEREPTNSPITRGSITPRGSIDGQHRELLIDQEAPTDALSRLVERSRLLFQKTPLMGILSMTVCLIGALDLPAYLDANYEPLREDDSFKIKLDQVSPLYSPAPFLTWMFCINTYMYDQYYYSRSEDRKRRRFTNPWFDNVRFFSITGYGLWAFADQIRHAWKGDFGPSHAASRFVADKAMESFTIVFLMYSWHDFLQRKVKLRPGNGLPFYQTLASTPPYLYWPPIVFFLVWCVGRALEHIPDSAHVPEVDFTTVNATAYSNTAYNSTQSNSTANAIYTISQTRKVPHAPIHWDPIIDPKYRWATVPVGICLAFLTTPRPWSNRLWRGFPKMFYLSEILLHTGLFGTLGPFKLTSTDFRKTYQWVPFAITVIGTAYQYWLHLKKSPTVVWERMRYAVGKDKKL